MSTTTLTVRIDDETKERLDRLAAATDRTKSYLVSNAIKGFIEVNEWQIEEIKSGTREAEAGELVGHEAVADRWRRKLAGALDKKGKPKLR